jgi:hypothetical protein
MRKNILAICKKEKKEKTKKCEKKYFLRLLFLIFEGTQGSMVPWVMILQFCF